MRPDTKNNEPNSTLRARRLGIDTHQEPVVYMRVDCHVCRAEGLASHARVRITHQGTSILATLHHVRGDLLRLDEAGLSEAAWQALGVRNGDALNVSHPPPLDSFSHVRAKSFGHRLDAAAWLEVIRDVAARRYGDVHLAALITACGNGHLDREEIIDLTRAMIAVGERIDWGRTPIADKHSIGGLAGNRTSPIVVAIVAACGLTIPKTSSRAITSPSGTADTMETLTRVDLDLSAIRRVVEAEGGCLVWGGVVRLSPADDILIRVERALDLDAEGQLVASVLSKKAAAGATHLVLDIPVGPSAKVRTATDADRLAGNLMAVADALEITTRTLVTDGTQPIGRGIGPALEARDVLAVLQNAPETPLSLRVKSIQIAGAILELAGRAVEGSGMAEAETVLANGTAWRKFQAICQAQGGLREPPRARCTHVIASPRKGRIVAVDNRRLSNAAKLAGAPDDKAAGLDLHVTLDQVVERDQPLFTLHAETAAEIAYVLDYLATRPDIIRVDPT